jgi:TolB protein
MAERDAPKTGERLGPKQVNGLGRNTHTFQGGPIGILPRWSPDGRRIVFSSRVKGNRDLYLTDSDGSNTIRLTSEPSQEEFPSWSGDGRWICFRSDRTGRGQIWKIPAAGGQPQQVTTGDG